MLRRLFGSRTRHRYDVGIDHFNAGRMEEAVAAFDEALDDHDDASDPDATLARFYRAEAHGRLGRERAAAGDVREALEHFDAALVDHPDYPDLHLQRAFCLLELDDALAAERAAMKALETNPEVVEGGLARMVALQQQGQTARARELAAEWRERARQRGDALADLFDDPATAFEGLRAIRRQRHDHRRATERVEGLLHEGLWAKAEEILADLLEQTPQYPDLRLRMAVCRAAQHDLTGATAHLDVALERNPDFVDGRVLSGIVELRRSRITLAREHFERAHARGNRSTPLLYGTALCALRVGRLDEAFARLEDVWRVERPGHEARALRAALLALTGRPADAAEAYGELVESSEARAVLLDAAAWGLQTSHHDLVRRALNALPDGPPGAATILARAELLRRTDDTERAIDVLEAATAELPDHPLVLWMLARVHADEGHHDVALRRLANLEALGRDVFGAAALHGRLLREQGNPDGSMLVLEEEGRRARDPATALEVLFTSRALGESDAADRQWARWEPLTLLDLRWRVQDPARWASPLPLWPSAPASESTR